MKASTAPTGNENGCKHASYAQQRLWILENLERTGAGYNIPIDLLLHNPLNTHALWAAINLVASRHDLLRSTFAFKEGSVHLQAHPDTQIPLQVIDLRSYAPTVAREEMERMLNRDTLEPFKLSFELPFRAIIILTNEPTAHLRVNFHHIVFDGWSAELFRSELTAAYDAYQQGYSIPALPELKSTYHDYVEWQRKHLASEKGKALLDQWTERLQGVEYSKNFPVDRPRPINPSPASGALATFEIPERITRDLNRLIKSEGSTQFMILLAAFYALLHRYTADSNFLIGTPVANRKKEEWHSIIGFFVNTVVVRGEVDSTKSFRTLLSEVKQEVVWVLDHQDLPFEQLIERLHPDRTLNMNPLFQIMFMFDHGALPEFSGNGVSAPVHTLGGVAKFDLNLCVRHDGRRLAGFLEYSRDLYDSERIDRLIGHYLKLLEAFCENPDRSLMDVQMLTDTEWHQLTEAWNETGSPYPDDRCVHELFEDRAEEMPDQVALDYEEEILTYREVNERANQFAHYLIKRGVVKEDFIAVHLPRGVDMIISLLGILKAGGAYVPIDIDYPQERIDYMLENAGAKFALTQNKMESALHQDSLKFINMGWLRTRLKKYDKVNPERRSDPSAIAYLIYTSGSTGKPKAGTIFHHAINRLVVNTNYINLISETRTAQASNISFDPSTLEIWGALCNGGTLVGMPEIGLLAAEELKATLEAKKIDVLFLPTTVFHQIASVLPNAFVTLQTLMVGGEIMDPSIAGTVIKAGAPENFLNVYGPSECTVYASTYKLGALDAEMDAAIPIGRPVSNTKLYILDEFMNPVPIGVPGELYIGGKGLGGEYFACPAETSDSYRPDPFSDEPGARLFRSKDRVQYRPDGQIEFLSRMDDQVKIRGFRICLGEIEHKLVLHPAVNQCVLKTRSDASGDRQLVAYYTIEGEISEDGPSVDELQAFLETSLPTYMIPDLFIRLEAFPLSPNNKIDRKQLPDPDWASIDLASSYIEPENSFETLISRIWAELLGLDQIGRNNDFFSMGGHSLLAMRAVYQVQELIGSSIAMRQIFETPTIAGFAQAVTEEHGAKEKLEAFAEAVLEDIDSEYGDTYQPDTKEQTAQ